MVYNMVSNGTIKKILTITAILTISTTLINPKEAKAKTHQYDTRINSKRGYKAYTYKTSPQILEYMHEHKFKHDKMKEEQRRRQLEWKRKLQWKRQRYREESETRAPTKKPRNTNQIPAR